MFICASKLIKILMDGCHSAALKGCGGRESADGEAVGECENRWGMDSNSILTADGRLSLTVSLQRAQRQCYLNFAFFAVHYFI
jgi:hypothetical protein